RIAFSIFRRNGMRDIATTDSQSHEIYYIMNDSINDRYPIWSPTGDSIVFLSFRNGTPNLYVSPSYDLGIVTWYLQQSEVTNAASNILAWDWSKKKDSILVTSFTDRNSVQLFWLAADHRITSHPSILPVEKKYTAWRRVRWPLVTRPADSLPEVIVTGPYAYHSLALIRPLLYFPIIGTDMTATGHQGTQWGALTFFTDEMQKHLMEAFAWYGDVSKTLSCGVEYENNQLLPTLSVGAAHVLEFRDVLQDIPYYEQTESVNAGATFSLHTPNSLTDLHTVFLGAEWSKFQPWNRSQFVALDSSERPISADMLDFGMIYTYLTPLFQGGVAAMHADKAIASDLTRTRLRAFLHKELPMGEDERDQFAILLNGAEDLGAELPQDFLGFYKYDAFEGGFNIATLHEHDRLRGIRRYYYGNRLLTATAELREADWLFSSFVPLLRAFEPQLVEFYDMGATWYANAPTNNPTVTTLPLSRTQWLKTAGIELRSELAFDISLEGGVGWEIVKNAPADWFLRVAGIF